MNDFFSFWLYFSIFFLDQNISSFYNFDLHTNLRVCIYIILIKKFSLVYCFRFRPTIKV